jgi:hypothetical protein
MVLVQELAIGEMDGEEPYVFGSIAALDVDARGRTYVIDRQASEVRVFSEAGEHELTMGGPGEGPGEFRGPDHIRLTGDGRVLIRDGRWRFSIFSTEGAYLESWPILSGFGSNLPFFLTKDGSVVNRSVRDGLVVYGPDGVAKDTLPYPTEGFDPNYLEVRNEHTRALYPRPFSPSASWTMTWDGRMLFGITSNYSIDRREADGSVFRIERAVEPVPVDPEEGASARERVTNTIRSANDPDWSWYGPDVPSEKPPWTSLLAGNDGTIWVFRSTVATEVENPYYDPETPDGGPPTLWQSPQVADVFDGEGRYLGPVKLPQDLGRYPPPLVSAEEVWAPAIHELGHPQVVRYRVAPAGAP